MILIKKTYRILKFILVALLVVLPIASPFSFSISKDPPLRLNIARAAFECPAKPTNITAPPSNYSIAVEKRDNSDGTVSCIYTIKNPDSIGSYTATQTYDQDGNEIKPKLPDILGEGRTESDPVSCVNLSDKLSNIGVCITRALFAGIGSLLIALGIKLVTMATTFFEIVLQYTIVNFTNTLSSFKDSIDTGWGAFRDVANIVIIAMFVFISINMILGVKEFGEKKLVARVLIIAVLLNFSLLFTRAIIDSSNFVAYQFYNQMVRGLDVQTSQAQQKAATTNPNLSNTNSRELSPTGGVAGKFLQFLGVSSIGQSYDVLAEAQKTNNNALIGLLYGILSFIFLLVTAFVFSYGALLLVTRAILLVLVMLTAAIAFAGWLIPHHLFGEAWTKWWKTLIKGAFLAPILMILLWITEVVASQIAGKFGSGGALGNLAANSSSAANIGTLFSFVFILGLIFASFYVANMFSQSISGFAPIGGIVNAAASLPHVTASRLGGLVLRNTVGKGLKSWGESVSAKQKERAELFSKMSPFAQARARSRGRSPEASFLERTKMNIAAYGGMSRFDALATAPGKALAKAVGAVTFGEDWGKGGYVGVKERQAQEAIERARKMGYESESQVRADAERRISEEQRTRRGQLDEEKNRQEGYKSTAGDVRDDAKAAARMALDTERRTAGRETGDDLERGHKTSERAKAQFHAQSTASENMERQRIANAVLITDENLRKGTLEDANERLKNILKEREEKTPELEASVEEAKRKLEEFNMAIEKAGDQAVEGAKRAAEENLNIIEQQKRVLDVRKAHGVESAAKTMSREAVAGRSGYTRLSTAFGIKQFFLSAEDFNKTLDEDPVGKRIAKASRKDQDREAALRTAERMRDLEVSPGAAAPSAPAAPRPPTPPPAPTGGQE